MSGDSEPSGADPLVAQQKAELEDIFKEVGKISPGKYDPEDMGWQSAVCSTHISDTNLQKEIKSCAMLG